MANGIWSTRDSDKGQKLVLEKAYIVGSNRQKPEFEQDFNIITTDKRRSFATFLPVAGLGTMQQKNEGAAPEYDSPTELIPYSLTYATWALGVKATDEGQMEDPEDISGKIPGMLAKSSRQTIDLNVYSVYNFAFDPRVLGPDGQPLCSQIHPLGPIVTPTGVQATWGTFSNSIGATALTPESYEQMRLLHVNMLDDHGMPDEYNPVKLVCGASMEKVAKEITGADKMPYSADNTPNVNKGFTVRAVRYISGQSYFLQAANGDPFSAEDCHGLFVAFKFRDKFRAWKDDETENYNQVTKTRMAYGFGRWRGIVGSQGSTGNS